MHLERIRLGLLSNDFGNEARVKQGIILAVLDALNWPIYDQRVVTPEFQLDGRRAVDYALCHPAGEPVVILEAKKVGGQGDDERRQLFEYAFHAGVQIVVLCDGKEWDFFLPSGKGNYDERRIYKLDVQERDLSECSSRLMRYLSYKGCCDGTATEVAKSDYSDVRKVKDIARALPDAWERLLLEPDEILAELLADKTADVCGYKPEPQVVIDFLQRQVGAEVSAHPKASSTADKLSRGPVRQQVRKVAEEGATKAVQPIGEKWFSLDGQVRKYKTGIDLLVDALNALLPDDNLLCAFAEKVKTKKRRVVARRREDLFDGEAKLLGRSRLLRTGWWLDSNNSSAVKLQYLTAACEVARKPFGKAFKVSL